MSDTTDQRLNRSSDGRHTGVAAPVHPLASTLLAALSARLDQPVLGERTASRDADKSDAPTLKRSSPSEPTSTAAALPQTVSEPPAAVRERNTASNCEYSREPRCLLKDEGGRDKRSSRDCDADEAPAPKRARACTRGAARHGPNTRAARRVVFRNTLEDVRVLEPSHKHEVSEVNARAEARIRKAKVACAVTAWEADKTAWKAEHSGAQAPGAGAAAATSNVDLSPEEVATFTRLLNASLALRAFDAYGRPTRPTQSEAAFAHAPIVRWRKVTAEERADALAANAEYARRKTEFMAAEFQKRVAEYSAAYEDICTDASMTTDDSQESDSDCE